MVTPRLIHAGIIIAAFFTMLTLFQTLILTLTGFFVQLFIMENKNFEGYMGEFIIYGGLFLVTLLIVSKSANIAAWLGRQGQVSSEAKVKLSYRNILTIVIIAYAFFKLVSKFPLFLRLLIDSFGDKIKRNGGLLDLYNEGRQQDTINWVELITEITLYLIILYAAKPISKWLTRKFDDRDDEFSFEDKDDPKEPGTKTTIEP